MSYAEAVRARLLEPLGLEHTWVEGSEEVPEEIVPGYSPEGEDVSHDIHPSRTWADSGIVSSAADLRAWGEALYLSDQVLSASSLELMKSETSGGWLIDFGLGVMVISQPPPLDALIGHTGGHLNGASTALFVQEEYGVVGVALLNAYDANAWGAASLGLKGAVKYVVTE